MKKTLLTLTALTVIGFANVASASEKQEVEGAFKAWQQSLSSGKAENVVNLYEKDSILLATLNPTPITDQKGRMEYFAKLRLPRFC